ncbi:MAG: hypothetical protein WC644_01185 [Ignavibacteria bacterium]
MENKKEIKPEDTALLKPSSDKHSKKSMKSNKLVSFTEQKKEAWDSGIKVLTSVDIIIPVKLLHVCNYIADKVRGDEFSILTNILEKDNDTITLSEEYYIPKQKVSTSSIDYLPDPEAALFNTVIHRHPNGMNGFSSTDRNYINQNFELSILYTKSDAFVNGIFNLKHNDYLIQIPVEIFLDYGIEDIDIKNIEKETDFGITFNRDRKKSKIDEWRVNAKPELSSGNRNSEESLFPEEKLDYNMMRELLLEEVNGELQNLDYRVTSIEDSMFHGGFSMLGEAPF